MACNGCFNGCTQITSDQCVKYTGVAIAALEIENGDPLSEVLEKLTDYLLTALDGTGIEPVIDPADLCTLINGYLTGATLNDVISAILQSLCDLQTQVTTDVANMTTLNADYVVGCLTGVTASSDTHAIVQAIITKLCAVNVNVTALQSALSQYVTIAGLNTLIQNYLTSIAVDHYYNKMIPYTAIEYYGVLSGYPTVSDGFDATGKGYGYWENIYLCNGNNGTPDKRGRIPVGCTSMRVGGFNIKVDPAISGNPTYAAPRDVNGDNTITLSVAQMPTHKHTIAAPTVIDPGHRHVFGGDRTAITPMGFEKYNDVATGYDVNADDTPPVNYGAVPFYTKSSTNQVAQSYQTTGISISVPDTSYAGSSNSHSNIPPVMACYYIMYIPATVPCP